MGPKGGKEKRKRKKEKYTSNTAQLLIALS
jgi:hypothetical protein